MATDLRFGDIGARQKKKPHSGDFKRSTTRIGYLSAGESQCCQKSWISAYDAPKDAMTCWNCGLYHMEAENG
jgi:hypothetical protein